VESPTNAQDMCNALLPALEASNRIPSERGGDASFKVLLAEDSAFFLSSFGFLFFTES
jgi:osomolarity two-component system sensor histidine kinase NIK1